MDKVLIFTIKYQNQDLVDRLKESIEKYTTYPYEFMVFDNDEAGNQSLVSVWNQVIGEARNKYICHLDTDVLVEEQWLENLVGVMESDLKIGFVGPMVDNDWLVQGKNLDRSWQIIDCDELSGFCMLIRKTAWQAVDGFCKYLFDFGSEAEFERRLNDAGWRTVLTKSVFIHHDGGATRKKLGHNRVELERKGLENYYANVPPEKRTI